MSTVFCTLLGLLVITLIGIPICMLFYYIGDLLGFSDPRDDWSDKICKALMGLLTTMMCIILLGFGVCGACAVGEWLCHAL